MQILVHATAKPIERTLNKLETKVKRNANDVGTSDTCDTTVNNTGTYIIVILFYYMVSNYLAFFQLVLRWRVLKHTLSTG